MACCMASMSLLVLRRKKPNLDRSFRKKRYGLVGIARRCFGLVVAFYFIAFAGSSHAIQELVIVGGWAVLGVVFHVTCKRCYGDRFGQIKEGRD